MARLAGAGAAGATTAAGGGSATAVEATAAAAEAAGAERKPQTVREALCRALGHGPPIIEHAARAAGLHSGGGTPLPLSSSDEVDALFTQLSLLDDWLEGVAADTVAGWLLRTSTRPTLTPSACSSGCMREHSS
jgi:dihydrodipicolinate synthase/N-acetylneuraminate lyase